MTPAGFNAAEIFAIAKEMEQEGLAFYKAVAKNVTEPGAKALFLKLASDEVRHVRDIEQLEKHGEDYFPSEQDSLVAQYVQGIVDTKVFPPVSEVPKIAAAADGVVEAANFGIAAEKRAIEFYSNAAREARAAEAVEAFSRLLDQERVHLELLTALRRTLISQPPQET